MHAMWVLDFLWMIGVSSICHAKFSDNFPPLVITIPPSDTVDKENLVHNYFNDQCDHIT